MGALLRFDRDMNISKHKKFPNFHNLIKILCFWALFDEKEGKINHVGILLDNQHIIHASETSGKVVIDRIDQGGIISTTLKRRTHNLRVVKRMITK